MSISILPSRVQYLASKLFGIIAEVVDNSRYVVLSNGSKLLPEPVVILDGGQGEAMSELLGDWVACGIEANPARVSESRQDLPASCVSMRLTSRHEEYANLYLNLESLAAYQL